MRNQDLLNAVMNICATAAKTKSTCEIIGVLGIAQSLLIESMRVQDGEQKPAIIPIHGSLKSNGG
jgi:hypothetical protein